MIAPEGTAAPLLATKPGDAGKGPNASLIRALARAHRWKDMLECGSYNSITELAEFEGVNRSYLCRMLRLTLLSPEIAQAILNNGPSVSVSDLMQCFPFEWDQQRYAFQVFALL